LTRLGESLIELIGAGPNLIDDPTFIESGVKGEEAAQKIVDRASAVIKLASHEYKEVFMINYNSLLGKRLGLINVVEGDNDLFAKLLDVLLKTQVDYNQFFISLQNDESLSNRDAFLPQKFIERFRNPEDKIDRERNEELAKAIDEWLALYKARLESQQITYSERYRVASLANPKFIPRNWILEEVIDSIKDDDQKNVPILQKLLKMSSNPYDESQWGDELKELEAIWLNNEDDKKTMLQCSCSS
jgi:uncharacterized protein YdiU (UPF0061 family)